MARGHGRPWEAASPGGPEAPPDQLQPFGKALMCRVVGKFDQARSMLERQDIAALDANGLWTRCVGLLPLWHALGQEECFESVLAQALDTGPPTLCRRWWAWGAAVGAAEMWRPGT